MRRGSARGAGIARAVAIGLLAAGSSGALAADPVAEFAKDSANGSANTAATDPAPARWSLAVLAAQGVDANLIDMVPDAAAGELDTEGTYAAGLVVARRQAPPELLSRACKAVGLPACVFGWEASLLKHSGLQSQAELAGGVQFGFALYRGESVHLGFLTTQGLSYAFGTPAYEDGSAEDPDRRYRFQYHMAFELEAAPAVGTGWSAGLRIHHRSGLYGAVAPERVGSNFLGLVLRYTLP